jgi:hypothetical protein
MLFIDEDLRFDDRSGDAGDIADFPFDLLGNPLRLVEIVAVYLDGDGGLHAREHVTHGLSVQRHICDRHF